MNQFFDIVGMMRSTVWSGEHDAVGSGAFVFALISVFMPVGGILGAVIAITANAMR